MDSLPFQATGKMRGLFMKKQFQDVFASITAGETIGNVFLSRWVQWDSYLKDVHSLCIPRSFNEFPVSPGAIALLYN
jgi:hypothetical protein